eukprot:9487034-Pyramimonas_sp.AAC.1
MSNVRVSGVLSAPLLLLAQEDLAGSFRVTMCDGNDHGRAHVRRVSVVRRGTRLRKVRAVRDMRGERGRAHGALGAVAFLGATLPHVQRGAYLHQLLRLVNAQRHGPVLQTGGQEG